MSRPMRSSRTPNPAAVLATASLLSAVLAACAPAPIWSGVPVADGLPRASAGLCSAMVALPDLDEAARAFTNLAHDELHVLASDGRLDRSLQAAVLQAMQQVESDISARSGAGVLLPDMDALKHWTDTSLEALGEEVPSCEI
jgi:hypothetical protein